MDNPQLQNVPVTQTAMLIRKPAAEAERGPLVRAPRFVILSAAKDRRMRGKRSFAVFAAQVYSPSASTASIRRDSSSSERRVGV